MNLRDVISLFPEYPTDEALMAIESITTFPTSNGARIRCHLTHEFRIHLKLKGTIVTLTADNWPMSHCHYQDTLGVLKRMIHEMDAAIEAGTYHQVLPKPTLIFDERPEPPDDFDLPVWDSTNQCYYDAEY